MPPGGRRAGLTAHWFSRSVIGQNQRKHTGWLDAGEQLVYSPHTQSNYRFPAFKPLFNFVSGGFTRLGLRGARRAGLAPPADPSSTQLHAQQVLELRNGPLSPAVEHCRHSHRLCALAVLAQVVHEHAIRRG